MVLLLSIPVYPDLSWKQSKYTTLKYLHYLLSKKAKKMLTLQLVFEKIKKLTKPLHTQNNFIPLFNFRCKDTKRIITK
jgi:hypothetical protein